MNLFEKSSLSIIKAGILAIIAMFMLVIVYQISRTILGQVPSIIGTTVISIIIFYAYFTNQKFRETINKKIKF